MTDEDKQLEEQMTNQMKLTNTMVAEFIRTFEASLDPRLWVTLIREELKELKEAMDANNPYHVLKEVTDLMYVQIGFNLTSTGAEQLGLFSERETEEILKLLTEAAEWHGKAVEHLVLIKYNVNLFEAFRRVHLSNMSKLGDDGKPIKRGDGKILKGPHYKEPNLDDLIV